MWLRVYEVHVFVFVDSAGVDHTDQAACDGKRSHLVASHPPERRKKSEYFDSAFKLVTTYLYRFTACVPQVTEFNNVL